jgi:hypothetical protein
MLDTGIPAEAPSAPLLSESLLQARVCPNYAHLVIPGAKSIIQTYIK